MKLRLIKEGQERVFVLILDLGEEAFREITDFAAARSGTTWGLP